jgi:hypothetical protein
MLCCYDAAIQTRENGQFCTVLLPADFEASATSKRVLRLDVETNPSTPVDGVELPADIPLHIELTMFITRTASNVGVSNFRRR